MYMVSRSRCARIFLQSITCSQRWTTNLIDIPFFLGSLLEPFSRKLPKERRDNCLQEATFPSVVAHFVRSLVVAVRVAALASSICQQLGQQLQLELSFQSTLSLRLELSVSSDPLFPVQPIKIASRQVDQVGRRVAETRDLHYAFLQKVYSTKRNPRRRPCYHREGKAHFGSHLTMSSQLKIRKKERFHPVFKAMVYDSAACLGRS